MISFCTSFQPTLPARGATLDPIKSTDADIHFNPRSPRGERLSRLIMLPFTVYFNPRSPRGERRDVVDGSRVRRGFQPTLPARGATAVLSTCNPPPRDFNPRSPRGERLGQGRGTAAEADFNPRSREGSDSGRSGRAPPRRTFQPTLPRGERLWRVDFIDRA